VFQISATIILIDDWDTLIRYDEEQWEMGATTWIHYDLLERLIEREVIHEIIGYDS
jgi:hypothetical protein